MNLRQLMVCAVFLVVLGACSVQPSRPDTVAIAYELKIVPNNRMQRFEVQLHSQSTDLLCLKVSNWPDSNGRLLSSDSSILEFGDVTVSPIASELGRENCVTGCDAIELKQGQKLDGIVNYAAFGDPAKITQMEKKKLILRSDPHACSSSDYESNASPSLQALCENGLASCNVTK